MPSNDEKIKDTLLVGHAVYLELVLKTNPSSTVFQMLICPEAQSKLTPTRKTTSIAYRRQLTAGAPKKQWRFINPTAEAYAPGPVLSLTRRQYLDQTIERLAARGFEVFKQPIVVQVSEKDLEDICDRTTPYKLIGRVNKVRRKLGFPTTFIK
jgi:hypothetical protein